MSATLFDPERPATPAVAGPRPRPRPAPFVIELPAGLKLLNSNRALHYKDRMKLVAQLRRAARDAVRECPALVDALAAARPGPLFQRAHVLGVVHPRTNGRRDPANWYPSFKAAVDGLTDVGLFEDDDHAHVLGPDMRLGAVRRREQIVLVVRGLEPGEDPLGYRTAIR